MRIIAAKNSVRPSEGEAEGGCGGNSAAPERIKKEANPAALLVESRTPQKSFVFLLEEIGRAQIKKCKQNFSVVWRASASGGGLAPLVWFRSRISDKMSSSQIVKTHEMSNRSHIGAGHGGGNSGSNPDGGTSYYGGGQLRLGAPRKNLLPIPVFITGACVLIVEVTAVRVLSPHYGNTIFAVSSVISVILAALSIGYYAGGKIADRHPSLRWFFGIILASGLGLLALHFLGTIILPILSGKLSLASGPLVSSLLLFFAPALLLGALSPYAIKLESVQVPEQGVGSVSGKIFFWSTLGSIAGSLLAGFVLIPRFGIDRIFIATGAILFLLGLIPLLVFDFGRKRLIQALLAAVALALIVIFAVQQVKGAVLYSQDGVYEKITIYDGVLGNRPVRVLRLDRSISGAMFLDSSDPTDSVYEFSKYYLLYRVFKPDVKNALVIGGGAYSVPKALLAELPKATVDVSEIEPALFGLAKKYFRVESNPNLHNYTEDGRRLLRDSLKKYDFIFSDAYYSLFSIPPHLTTREFFSIAKEKLSDGGVIVANLIGDLSEQRPSLVFAEIKTFQSVFPNSYFFAVKTPEKIGSQNIMLVGYNSRKKVDWSAASILQNENPFISSLRDKVINLEKYDLSPHPILTDNYSPVEYLTAKVLQRTLRK